MPSRVYIPWPDHWRYNEHTVKCLVDGCGFEVLPAGLTRQFDDLKDHCKGTTGAEHAGATKVCHLRIPSQPRPINIK